MEDPNLFRGYRILVVDDEPHIAELLSENFADLGAQASTSNGGQEALAFIQANPVDLVITDLRMPNGDGTFLMEGIRAIALSSRPKVLFMTGYTDVKVEESLDMGAMGVIGKPMQRPEFLDLVRRVFLPPMKRWESDAKALDVIRKVVVREYQSVDEAVAQKQLAFGRGGFFLALEKDRFAAADVVRFKIQFKEGLIRNLEGLGIIQWTRMSASEGPKGFGIEIKSIKDPDRTQWVAYLDSLNADAFVPRLAVGNP